MSLTKEFFERSTNITARVVADSITAAGHRIVTIEAEYPRFILGEVNTHSAIEKNSSSSRAIPIKTMISQIDENMGTPLYWGKTQSGMQAGCEIAFTGDADDIWRSAFYDAVQKVMELSDLQLHKQTVNRLLEPFQMMKTVMTATDWDNFFNLRIHPDAQPEFCMLAYKIYKAIEESTPTLLREGEWHLPYIHIDRDNKDEIMYLSFDSLGKETHYREYSLEEAQRVSASCCAQTSYRKSDDSLDKADKIFDMLVSADVLHASPFGHLATPVAETLVSHKGDTFDEFVSLEHSVNIKKYPETWQEGITHMRRDGTFCSGNLSGWVSYRHLLQNNTCWGFNFEERMKLFT